MRRRDLLKGVIPAAASLPLLRAATVPRDAPDILISMPNGKPPLRLSQHKGKVILVEFLLTYCPHCKNASRNVEPVYREFKSQGFEVVGAAINAGGDVVQYVQELGLTFPVGSVSQETCLWFLQFTMMHRLQMPEVAFVDRKFQIVSQHEGNDPFFHENEVERLRKEVLQWLKPENKSARK